MTPPVVRLVAVERHCLECESPLSVGQDPNAPRRYDFAAREIAAALVALANGATYSQAAFGARQTVAGHDPDMIYGRRVQPGQVGPNGEPSRHGTLVASGVETYVPVVLGSDSPRAEQIRLFLDDRAGVPPIQRQLAGAGGL